MQPGRAHADGTGTYKAEIYQDGLLKTHFFPHPGSTGWSQAAANLKNAVIFLRDLTAGTPKRRLTSSSSTPMNMWVNIKRWTSGKEARMTMRAMRRKIPRVV